MTEFIDDVADQRMEALAKAKYVKKARADYKVFIKGLETPYAVARLKHDMARPPSYLEKMPVVDVLRQLRGFGHYRARLFMQHAGIAEGKRIGAMTARQRQSLGDELDKLSE